MVRTFGASSFMNTDSNVIWGAPTSAPQIRSEVANLAANTTDNGRFTQCRVHGCTPRHMLDGSVACEYCGVVIRPCGE